MAAKFYGAVGQTANSKCLNARVKESNSIQYFEQIYGACFCKNVNKRYHGGNFVQKCCEDFLLMVFPKSLVGDAMFCRDS